MSVYEETAGLMVNDPVLRTHKVIFLLNIFMISRWYINFAHELYVHLTASVSGIGTRNIGKYF